MLECVIGGHNELYRLFEDSLSFLPSSELKSTAWKTVLKAAYR